MGNSTAILALQKVREDYIKSREIDIVAAAKPWNEKIAEIEKAINQLKDIDRGYPLEKVYESVIKKRGRKPKLIESTIYPYDGTILAKFLYVLREANHFLSIGEVGERVKRYEPDEDLTLIKIKFGKHVNKFRAEGKIVSTRDGSKYNTLYGLPEFLDEDGNIKKGLRYGPNWTEIEIKGYEANLADWEKVMRHRD